MTPRIGIELIEGLRSRARDLLRDSARRLPHLRYADARVEVVEARAASAENGAPRFSGDGHGLTLGVRVLAGQHAVAPGYLARSVGVDETGRLPEILRDAIERAWRRAAANAEGKADARGKFPDLGESLADTLLHPVDVHEDTLPAVYDVDPRTVDLQAMSREVVDLSRALAALDPRLAYQHVGVHTQLSRELFASSEGALVDQSFALTHGACGVVAVSGSTSQDLWDTLGHQRGWEILDAGVGEPFLHFPPFREFALALARESLELVEAPPLPSTDGEVVVVTDPHYNTLVSHEIMGHPAELDRALKMETAYAGRSWLLGDRDHHQVGHRVASALVSAYSDPSLPGYGHYRYDHEGTPARRVVHIDRGIFTGFMNSRQTAALFGRAPNGHYVATTAGMVPLVRMSNTVFAAGEHDPADIVAEVDHGWYVAGHRVPSIAESRENFRITARRVYEIRRGRIGQLYRDGGLTADTRDYLLNVDAVGTDFRLYPIPNCGKGQPMQVKRLGNGGPTMRSRARLTGV